VQVGDSIGPGDVLCEVETDKATIAWEAQEEGFLAAILLPGGSKDVAVGTPAAVIVEEEVRGTLHEDVLLLIGSRAICAVLQGEKEGPGAAVQLSEAVCRPALEHSTHNTTGRSFNSSCSTHMCLVVTVCLP